MGLWIHYLPKKTKILPSYSNTNKRCILVITLKYIKRWGLYKWVINHEILLRLVVLIVTFSSTESDMNTWIGKAWTAIDWLLTLWKSDHSDKIKLNSVNLLPWQYYYMTASLGGKARWELHRDTMCCFEQILEAKPYIPQLYDHLPLITQTIQERWTCRYCWSSKDKLISDILIWSPTYG